MKPIEEKARRWERISRSVKPAKDRSRVHASVLDKWEQDLRDDPAYQAKHAAWWREMAKREVSSLMELGETEAYGILTISPKMSLDYYPLMLLKDDNGFLWEFREAPIRVVSLWVKQFAVKLKRKTADLDDYVTKEAKAVAAMTAILEALQHLEKLFKRWTNERRDDGWDEQDLDFGSFLTETGLTPPSPCPPSGEDGISPPPM